MFYPYSKRQTKNRQELWILVLSLCPIFAFGSPILEFVGGQANEGLTSRYTETAQAVYFNPALMHLTEEQLFVSYFSWHRTHQIKRFKRPSGYDVPDSVFEARVERDGNLESLDFRPLPSSAIDFTQNIDDTSQHQFVLFSFSKPIFKEKLSASILTVLPLSSFQEQRPYFVDERAQFFGNQLHFEHLDGKFGNLVLSVGINWKPLERLILGTGLTLASHSLASPKVFVSDAANTQTALTLSQVRVESALVPHLGLKLALAANWDVTATLHLPYQTTVRGASELRFWEQEQKEKEQNPVTFKFAYDYLPLRASLGQKIHWRIGEKILEISGGIQWQQWSSYIDRMGEVTEQMKDTISPEVQIAYSSESHRFQVSSAYRPSSVPEQSGRTNYVDNDQVLANIGYTLSDRTIDFQYELGLGATFYTLISRQNWKNEASEEPIIDELPNSTSIKTGQQINESLGLQTNNPGFPGFESFGMGLVWGVSVGIKR